MWLEWIVDPLMLELIAKLLVVICLPVTAAIVWKIRTRATWVCLVFAFGAIIIYVFARIPLVPVVLPLADRSVANPFVKVWPYVVSLGIIYGFLREGIRWLLMRFAVKTVWSWEEGVFFGICYSVLTILFTLGNRVHTTITVNELWHPSQILPHLNDHYLWMKVLVGVWEWSIPLIAFNVGTSLAVLLSVRRRQAWPFLIAVLFFVVHAMPPALSWPLKSVLESAGVARWHSLDLGYLLLNFIAVLPPIWFTLHLRRTESLARGR